MTTRRDKKYVKNDLHNGVHHGVRTQVGLTVLVLTVGLGLALAIGFGLYDTSLGASPSRHVSAACATAKLKLAKVLPGASQLTCAKARRFAAEAPSGDPSATKPTFVVQPTPPVAPPANDGVIQTTGIEQSADAGTSITALWMDLEDGMYVDVQSGSELADPSQGTLDITVINPNGYVINSEGQPVPEPTGSVDAYAGGEYLVPGSTGAITLTAVSGTLFAGDMIVSFTNASGNRGTFEPATASFSSQP